MKTLKLVILSLLFTGNLIAQVGINTDGSQPDSSAMLDVKSSNSGILFPRLTESERNALPSPANGLLIYNTTSNRFNYYTLAGWYQVEASPVVFSTGTVRPGGGISINISGEPPDSSAMLDVDDNSRGVLIPRTDTLTIPSPVTGLIMYDTITNLFNYYDGTRWKELCSTTTGVPGATGSQFATGVVVNTTGAGIDQSAILDVSATNKGFLIPRMTGTQRNALFPVSGLTIYNLTAHAIEYYDGTGWCQLKVKTISSPARGIHVPAATQISWKWDTVPGAEGYRWNTVNDFQTATDMGTGNTKIETGLTCNTAYQRFVWAYSSCGVSPAATLHQNTWSCTPCSGLPAVTYGGMTYTTVQIGSQCWMAQNLNIGTFVNESVEQTDNNTIEKYCQYNAESGCDIYGGFYQWDEMMQYSTSGNNAGICPAGWHIPLDGEWSILTSFLGGESVAGGKMKSTSALWCPFNEGASNSSGFKGEPAGFKWENIYPDCEFAIWWTSNQEGDIANAKQVMTYDASISDLPGSKSHAYSVRCLANPNPPTVTTTSITNITQTSASSGGNVTSAGGSVIIKRGVCWSTSENPTTDDSLTVNGSGTGVFVSTLTGLLPNTKYYVRAYATNSMFTTYGNQVSFTTEAVSVFVCGSPLIDNRNGKTYATIQIGTQCWMAQNLDLGNRISGSSDQTNNGTYEKYCYNNIDSNCDVYGGMYQWAEAVQYINGGTSTTAWNPMPAGYVQGICPTGWHIPKGGTELEILATYLGGPDIAGGKMKEAGTAHWASPNTGATNSSGFTGLPAGLRSGSSFEQLSYRSLNWSSKNWDADEGHSYNLEYNLENLLADGILKSTGLSVRCLKDTICSTPTVTTASVTNIQYVTATCGGNVETEGGTTVPSRGVCWSTSSNPTINNSHTINGSGAGAFVSAMTGLTQNTVYYVRAYATNSNGTSYGNEVTFTTKSSSACEVPLTDPRDGKTYATLQIGNQCWMAQNLNYSAGNGSWCYNDDASNCNIYGQLYNKLTAYVACPPGWHLANHGEWTTMTDYVNSQTSCQCNNGPGWIAKALAAKTLWGSSNVTCAVGNDLSSNNATGFSGLPGGCRNGYGQFQNAGSTGYWWSNGDARMLTSFSPDVLHYNYEIEWAFSVRCIKDTVPLLPTVITIPVTNIAQTTATGGGNVKQHGGTLVTARGVCWSTTSNPTIADSHTTNGSGLGTFVSSITGLTANTLYYVRAYATNSIGTAYGSALSFTTLPNPVLPTVTTDAVANITQTSASGGGNVTSDGGAAVTARGVCWSTTSNPTISDSHTTDGSGTGTFASSLTGLTANTLYYVRAYATNTAGTGYGNELSFTTLPNPFLPVVTTTAIANITQTSASGGGNVTSDGGSAVTARGVCWSTTSNPTISDSHTTDGSGTGTFVSSLAGLTAYTLYYVRAYATNTAGTGYGNELSFTTLPNPILPIVTTTAMTNITQTTATGGGNVTSDGGAPVTTRGVCWSTTSNPTTSGSHTTDGSGTGPFTSNLTGLNLNTLYYVRAYAINNVGTTYGNEISFTTADTSNAFVCGSTLIDSRDGKTYTTVQIGTQCWMAQNLNLGTRINGSDDLTDNGIYEKYCYGNLESNCDVYGGLYHWAEAVQYLNGGTNTTAWNPVPTDFVQGICPTGWHIPRGGTEIEVLSTCLGGPALAGGKMKEAGTTHWSSPNTGATNSSGFTGLPGGSKSGSSFYQMGNRTLYWSSQDGGPDQGHSYYLEYDKANLYASWGYKIIGRSVRCLMDTYPTVLTAAVTNFSSKLATGGGNVTSDGGSTVTARGVCWSLISNPTTSDCHTTDGSGMGSFISNLTGLAPNTTYYVRAYAISSYGTAYGNETSFTTLPPYTCGTSLTINHFAGTVAPVDKTVTYGTVTNIPGETSKCWITSNLGADHQATSKNDATEPSAGWYWQFNRQQGYKCTGSTRVPNITWITSISENLDWQAANDPCALELQAGWRIPTYTEWYNVDITGGWGNWDGPWNSGLKIHAAGKINSYNGYEDSRGSNGFYWSSTQNSLQTSWNLSSASGQCYTTTTAKAFGFSLRCIKE